MQSGCAVSLSFVLLLCVGCGDDSAPADAGTDAGTDASPDAGFDGGFDGGTDASLPDTSTPDAMRPDAAIEGCDLVSGVECDGDWAGRCAPECGVDECCSPQSGRFECVPRDAEGACPAANIWVDTTRIEGLTRVEWQFFPDDDCALFEGCVAAPGWRRLLRFATWTPNTGEADLYLGVPDDMAEHFTYSECHGHYHFDSYAEYELRADDGSVVAEGHKQAFCLLDFYRYPGEDDDRGAVYGCDDQGIQRDWQDVYGEALDCQWVDVTDVPAGDYVLHIALNTEHILLESDYTDNEADVTVTIPDDVDIDITTACAGAEEGHRRECGWARQDTYDCTAGEMVTVACSETCGLGSCTGDTILRACEASFDPTCSGRHILASNDDSGCNRRDLCSRIELTCPASGSIVVFTGSYDPTEASTCNVAVMSTP